jgi:hypothetical protein
MPERMQLIDRNDQRWRFARDLLAAATGRYGAERAEALRAGLETTAGQLADLVLFPLGSDERPEFFFNRRL